MHKLAKITLSAGLALTLTLAAAPAAEASYYNFIRQHLQQQQQTTQPTTQQPTQQPSSQQTQQPATNNFWTNRSLARRNWLNNTQQPTQPQQTQTQQATQPTAQPNQPTQTQSGQLTAREQQMLDLVNQERRANGLRPLQADMRLTRLARIKSQDIVDNNYFAHQSPTHGSAFDMMRAEGIAYRRGGENLSRSGGVQVSHLRLMNSAAHRANILNPNYTHVGIGIVNGRPSGIVATQIFIQAP